MTSKKAVGVISMSHTDKDDEGHTITQETGKPRWISECETKHLVADKIKKGRKTWVKGIEKSLGVEVNHRKEIIRY